jgi:hypothetical protein
MLKHIARLIAFLLTFSLAWAQDESPFSNAVLNFPAETFERMVSGDEAAWLFRQAVGLSGENLFTEELCISSELNGQKAYIAGGGYTAMQSWGNAYWVGSYWGLVDPVEGESSTLLIVDDFTTIKSYNLSHGALVFRHVLEALRGLSPTSVSHSGNQSQVMFEEHTLTVLRVDISFSDATSVGAALAEELPHLSGPIVLNMSWGVIVCGLNTDFEKNRAMYPKHKYESYLMAAAEVNRGLCRVDPRLVDYVISELVANGSTDADAERDCALLVLLAGNEYFSSKERVLGQADEQMQNHSLTIVAAAGNVGLQFALVPASWDGVIAVCGSDLGAGGLADYSNKEEVMAPGGVFALNLGGQMLEYAGTSFASPLAALAQALTGNIPQVPCQP